MASPSENPSRTNAASKKDTSKVHKLSLKGSAKLVAEFFQYSIHSILYQRGVYPAEDFTVVKKYGLSMLVSSDDQVKAYIRRIMAALDRWMKDGRVQKLVIVITDKDTGEHVERWQFDVNILAPSRVSKSSKSSENKSTASSDAPPPTLCSNQENNTELTQPASTPAPTEIEIQSAIASLFRQITASVTFLPQLDAGSHTFNVLVYADAATRNVPLDWGDSVDGGKEIVGGERVQLRGFSTGMHEIGTVVDYRGDF
ncbi:unnamed protein product [Discula destructiva]